MNVPEMIDVNAHYKSITESFVKHYYSLYTTTPYKLGELYASDSRFTVFSQEFVGYDNFVKALVNAGIKSLTHSDINVHCQPIDSSCLLIISNGYMKVNDSLTRQKFQENIVLRRDNNNNFFVTNTILLFFE